MSKKEGGGQTAQAQEGEDRSVVGLSGGINKTSGDNVMRTLL